MGGLQAFDQPQVNERLRQQAALPGLFFNLLVDFWIDCDTSAPGCANFKLDLVSLIPVVSRAMRVPELGDFFQGSGFRDAGQLCIIIFAHGVFFLNRPCLVRSI
jgi:hypothetical protein